MSISRQQSLNVVLDGLGPTKLKRRSILPPIHNPLIGIPTQRMMSSCGPKSALDTPRLLYGCLERCHQQETSVVGQGVAHRVYLTMALLHQISAVRWN